MRIKSLLCSFVISIIPIMLAHADDLNKNISVDGAWVQAMPSSQTTTAAYMVITNNSPHEAVITSVSSNIADKTEIHQMSEVNGMMHMAFVPQLHIPANGKVVLQPGGFHIMLIGLKRAVDKEGSMISITFHFQDGNVINVNAPVKTE